MSQFEIELRPEDVKRFADLATSTAKFLAFFQSSDKGFSALTASIRPDEVEIRFVEFRIEDLDLNAPAINLFGITDPIGQIAGWIIDRIREFASWIARTAESVFRTIVNTIIVPLINAVKGGVDWLMGRLSDVWNSLTGLVTFIRDRLFGAISVIANIVSTIRDAIAGIPNALAGLWRTLTQIPSMIINGIRGFIEAIHGAISAVSNAIRGVWDFLSRVPSMIINGIRGFFATVYNVLSNVGAVLGNVWRFLTQIPSMIINGVRGFFTAVYRGLSGVIGVLQNVWNFLTKLPSMIVQGVQRFFGLVYNAITVVGRVLNDVWRFLAQIPNVIINGVRTAINVVYNAVRQIPQFIINLGRTIWNGLEMIWNFLTQVGNHIRAGFEAIGRALTGFINAILKFPEWFPKWFYEHIAKPIVDGFSQLGKWIWEHMPDWIKDAWRRIHDFFVNVWNGIVNFFKDPIGSLQKAFEQIGNWIWNALPPFMREAFERIRDFFVNVWNGIVGFFKDPIGSIQRAFEQIGQWIWNALPPFIRGAFEKVHDFFVNVWNGIVGFFKDPVGSIVRAFNQIGQWIWNALPDWLKGVFETLGKWTSTAWETLTKWGQYIVQQVHEFFKDPWAWFRTHIVKPMIDGMLWLAEQVTGFFTWLFKTMSSVSENIGKTIISAFVDIGQVIAEGLKDVAKGLMSAGVETAQFFMDVLVDPLKTVFEGIRNTIVNLVGGKGMGEITLTMQTYLQTVPVVLWAMMPEIVASAVPNPEVEIELSGEPGGVGGKGKGKVKFDVRKIMKAVAKTLRHVAKSIVEAIALTMTYITFKPFEFVLRASWRNVIPGDIPLEIPPLEKTIDIVQRHGYGVAVEKLKDVLRYLGYPMWFIDGVTKTVAEWSITITDRFGKRRTVPLALMYEQPTKTDLCRFMVRDVFASLDEFTKWMYRIGVYPDIAYLFYMLHFRYISPEKLWEFVMRGVSGLLWYSPPPQIVQSAIQEARKVGAFEPVSPMALNFNASKLFEALSRYMKWHDYALFAWVNGFTSDNWAVIDVLADIPGKIDQRWMVRWGVFEHMALKGIKLTTPVAEFTKVIEPNATNPKVAMDLTLFCRMLQATGLHPYYVPIVAVAETMNAYTEERTLTRTGIINLYERGLTTFDALEQIMANFVTASFKVAYFDMREMKWKEGWINIPIMFLPGERKLLIWRALMDRVDRIWRELLPELETGYREWYLDADDVKSIAQSVAKTLSEYFASMSEQIAGRKIELKLDESFIEHVLKAWTPAREIYARRFVRYLAHRIMGWLIYRLAYGYVTKTDVEKVVEVLKQRFYLIPAEVEAVKDLLDTIIGVVRREYVPSPWQLTHIAEYVPVPIQLLDKSLEAHNVPDDFRDLIRKYFMIRPFTGEVNALASTLRMLAQRFAVPGDVMKEIETLMRQYGWRDLELKFFNMNLQLRHLYGILTYMVPTIRGFVHDAMYLPNWERAFEWVLKLHGVDVRKFKPLVNYYKTLIRNRKAYRRAHWYATRLVRAYAYGIIDRRTLEAKLNWLKQFGLSDEEIHMYIEGAEYERKIHELRRR